jgi:DNA-binding transcriptional MerR regulator
MAKICYKIGEVAELLGESTSLVRFWSDKFENYIKLQRNNKGNRLYSPEDVECLKRIHFYVKERGMTLDGVERLMNDNKGGVDNSILVVNKLKEIKSLLLEVKSQI